MPKPDVVTRIARKLRRLRIADSLDLSAELEPSHLKRLFHHFAIDCVFDVGGNFGQYATMLRDRVDFDGLIVTFEPIPSAAETLRRKAASDKNWFIEEVALSDRNGTANFNVMVNTEFSSLSAPRHDQVSSFANQNRVENVVSVKTETLGHAFERLKADHQFKRPFLKLDTQGFDTTIVGAAADVLHEFIGMQSELAVKRLYESSSDFREALTLYERCGFELSTFVPNNAGHFPRLIEIDCVMIRSDLMGQTHATTPS